MEYYTELGSEDALDIKYLWYVNETLNPELQRDSKAELVGRYDNLSYGQIDRIMKLVDRHEGSQNALIQGIEKILWRIF